MSPDKGYKHHNGCAREMKRLQGEINLYFQKGYNVVTSAEELSFLTEGARHLVKDMFKNFRIIIVMVCSSLLCY